MTLSLSSLALVILHTIVHIESPPTGYEHPEVDARESEIYLLVERGKRSHGLSFHPHEWPDISRFFGDPRLPDETSFA